MKHLRLPILLLAVAVAIGAVVVALRQQRALELQRIETAKLQRELEDLRAAKADADRLRQQTSVPMNRLGDESELARLRAESAELRRLRDELAKLKAARAKEIATAAAVANAAAASATNAANRAENQLTAKGTAQLKHGESFVTGGWDLGEGKRGYALITPTMHTGADGQTAVFMESRVFAIPESALAATGLQSIIVSGRDADQYGVTDAAMTRQLFERIGAIQGAEVLSAPSVSTLPGRDATIQVGGQNGGGLTLQLSPTLNDSGLNLGFNFGLNRANPSKP